MVVLNHVILTAAKYINISMGGRDTEFNIRDMKYLVQGDPATRAEHRFELRSLWLHHSLPQQLFIQYSTFPRSQTSFGEPMSIFFGI